MKNFDSRTYSINDFIEWDDRGQLEISPKFQRRSVWSPQAKSYLIDTILKDKPLPKIFIRATTDPKTKKTTREIVDGQQRIRTILSFVKDGFRISKVHNEEFGGMLYSELPDEVQGEFLKYELSVDLLLDVQDRDILDVFARLNTYSVSLNNEGFRDEGDVLFPETTREFFDFIKETAGDDVIVDIAVSDEDFQCIELHSAAIEVATIIVESALFSIAINLVSSFLYDLIKKYHRKAEDTSAKVKIITEETDKKKTKMITYEGPVSGVKDTLDQVAKDLFSKDKV